MHSHIYIAWARKHTIHTFHIHDDKGGNTSLVQLHPCPLILCGPLPGWDTYPGPVGFLKFLLEARILHFVEHQRQDLPQHQQQQPHQHHSPYHTSNHNPQVDVFWAHCSHNIIKVCTVVLINSKDQVQKSSANLLLAYSLNELVLSIDNC